jgi:hypothetical protein
MRSPSRPLFPIIMVVLVELHVGIAMHCNHAWIPNFPCSGHPSATGGGLASLPGLATPEAVDGKANVSPPRKFWAPQYSSAYVGR